LHYFWSCMLPRSAQTKHSPIRMRAMHISNDAIFVSLPERSWPAYAHFTGAIFFERLFTNHRTAMRCFDWHFVSVCY
jgi:hypothetical protein